MFDGDKIALARSVEQRGGQIIGKVPSPWGWAQAVVEPADLPLFLDNHTGWILKVLGVTVADLEAYEEFDAIPRCGARTKTGRACRAALSGQCEPRDFARLHRNGVCTVHAQF